VRRKEREWGSENMKISDFQFQTGHLKQANKNTVPLFKMWTSICFVWNYSWIYQFIQDEVPERKYLVWYYALWSC
jgi:hypothetical protein